MAAVAALQDAPATDAHHVRLTLAGLLSVPPLRAGAPVVLVGSDRLGTAVRWVHAGDEPDVGAMLRHGDVLLTTGMTVGSVPAAQRRFIDLLADHGAAAVIIELGDADPDASTALAERAAERHLPLIVLRRPVRFVDVTEAAHRRILTDRSGELRRADAVERDLTTLMLDGADTATMLEWLAQRTSLALSLLDDDGATLFHAPTGTHTRQDMRDAMATARLIGCDGPAWLPVPGAGGSRVAQLALPCHDGALEPVDRALLEAAAGLLALSLQRRWQVETLIAREHGALLDELISGELSGREDEAGAAELGCVGSVPLIPVVVAGRAAIRMQAQQDSWAFIMRRVQNDLAADGIPMFGGLIDGGRAIVALVGVPSRGRERSSSVAVDEGRRAEIAGRVDQVLQSHVARHLRTGGRAVLCVGETVAAWAHAGARVDEVVRLAPRWLEDSSATWIDLGRPDTALLLRHVAGNDALERFAQRRLEPLERHDEVRRSELLRTLEALFEHNGNKADTARALYLERQSLYGRLERVEELLDEPLSDESTRLGLQLALHLRRSRGEREPGS